ncbi:MAG TPA: helix-turn-helix domain-containing protein [Solirubrobacterales bacterium]|nr:helix-turn-helix domain-containing protein [Solirubrobacterales bacterium]
MDVPNTGGDVLSQPTRARIFAVLVERKGAAGTEELAEQLGLHPNGVRRHLDRLQEAGLVERRRARGERGRPRDRWLVAAGAHPGGERPRAYTDLARWLARAIRASSSRLREIEQAGREIGRELASGDRRDPVESLLQVMTALGFQPELMAEGEGELVCRLDNCPYRDSVRQNADVVCTLHRGITGGLLAELDPGAKLTRFEPHDPDRAGCLIEVSGGGWRKASATSPERGRAFR